MQPDTYNVVKAIEKANLTIALKGLALSNYREENRRWETIFMRHIQGHNLKIIIKKIRNGKLSEENSYDIGPDVKTISITHDQAENVNPRYESGDDLDIRRLVDFCSADMFGRSLTFNPSVRDTATTLDLSNACFYTKTNSPKSYSILKDDAHHKTSTFGVITGADVVLLGGKAYINIDGSKVVIPLEYEDGLVYEVIFDNDCHASAPGSADFDTYNDLFDMPHRFTMKSETAFSMASAGANGGGDPAPPDEDDPSAPSSPPEGEPPPKEPPCNSALGG